MRQRFFKLYLIVIVVFAYSGLNAQEMVTAAGGNVSSGDGSVSNSIGLLVFASASDGNGSVTEGVQQPYEISQLVDINDIPADKLKLTVSPNPVVQSLLLKVESTTFLKDAYTYNIYSSVGGLISQGKLTESETVISMMHIKSGVYFLRIDSEDNKSLTYKIIKN